MFTVKQGSLPNFFKPILIDTRERMDLDYNSFLQREFKLPIKLYPELRGISEIEFEMQDRLRRSEIDAELKIIYSVEEYDSVSFNLVRKKVQGKIPDGSII